jgi:hypothetical protein
MKWIKAVEEEHINILGNEKKANGSYKARITARGFQLRDGEHFDSNDKASPVVSDITIRIILTPSWWPIYGQKS